MGAKLGSGGGPIADINVTPLIDVVLVLLVVFMVVTPMLQSGLPVDLPVATQSETVNDVGQFIVVSVTEDRGWWVEQESVDVGTLVEAINVEYAKNPSRAILVKADKDLEYGKVREVMDILGDARITSILVAAAKE
ncbi:MAG: biopolymer transporter ExbD [Alphaproteobacteria bacterium]|nr:biopolymer transporter ExbD [Alphaproteobacteria bacterium]